MAMTTSTASRLSRPKSFVKDAVADTSETIVELAPLALSLEGEELTLVGSTFSKLVKTSVILALIVSAERAEAE